MANEDEEKRQDFEAFNKWCFWTIHYAIVMREQTKIAGTDASVNLQAVKSEASEVLGRLWAENEIECKRTPGIGLEMMVRSIFRFALQHVPH